MSQFIITCCILAASLVTSLTLTPLLISAAKRFKILDRPSARRVHADPIPRLGGPALYAGFFLPLLVSTLLPGHLLPGILADSGFAWLCAGATLVFTVGLIDDLITLSPWVKLSSHLAAAGLAYLGGIRIHVLSLTQTMGVELGLLSLPLTLFWFVPYHQCPPFDRRAPRSGRRG